MRAVVYSETGAPDVLRLVERPVPEPGPGEARVAVAVSGVNPTDWKARRFGPLPSPEVVPNQDGAGRSTRSATGSTPPASASLSGLGGGVAAGRRNGSGVRRPPGASGR